METTLKNLFLDEPKEITFGDGRSLEIYEYGESFEATKKDNLQIIKPFIFRITDTHGYTEIGIGYITEDNKTVDFWSLHEFGLGKDSKYYPLFKKAMKIFQGMKVIKNNTLACCYYVATGEMILSEGKFLKFKEGHGYIPSDTYYNIVKEKVILEEKKLEKAPKKKRFFKWFCFCSLFSA